MLESLFNKVAGLESEICEIFKNIYFEEHLRATASGRFYRQILTVRNFNLILTLRSSSKDCISIAVLRLVGFGQFAPRKELIIAPFLKCFKEATL